MRSQPPHDSAPFAARGPGRLSMKVTHLTSVHPRNDTRIFVKQCRSLAANGYEVSLVVADGKGDEQKDGVKILDVGYSPGRFNRIFGSTQRVLDRAVKLNAHIYHLHDPELIPIGLRLKKTGGKVIFDAHEDLPKQLLGKPYLGPLRLRMLAGLFSSFERYACRRFDGVVAATPTIGDKYQAINPRTVVINNFPLLDELNASMPWDSKQAEVCYVGSISAMRGIREIIAAMGAVQSSARLTLAGEFFEAEVEAEVETLSGWNRTNALGFVDRERMRCLLGRSIAGLVTFHPLPNHTDAQPSKMFEYMSAGIPVIASDFPLWREIIEGNACGICVDPLDSAAIASAIDDLVTNRDKAQRMGENGRAAVMSRYNWPVEENKLLSFYSLLLQSP